MQKMSRQEKAKTTRQWVIFGSIVMFLSMAIIGAAGEKSKYEQWMEYRNNLRADPNLVAYYDFQEEDEGNILKNWGKANEKTNGTLINGPKWATGRWPGKQALEFDGVNDYVDCGNDQSLNISGAITVEVWVKMNTKTNPIVNGSYGSPMFVNKFNYVAGKYEGWILGTYIWGGNTTEFTLYNSSGSSSKAEATTPSLHEWHHIAGVYKPSQYVRLYIDGNLAGENTKDVLSSFTNSASNLVIGKRSDASCANLNGAIDEVAICKSALTEEEIKKHYEMGRPSKTVIAEIKEQGVWHFDEGKDRKVTDSSNNKNDGMLIGDCKWVEGKFGKALQFNDNSAYMEITNSESLNFVGGKDVTLEMWIRRNEKAKNHLLLEKREGSLGYTLALKEGKISVYYGHRISGKGDKPGDGAWTTPIEVPANEWCHIAVVRSLLSQEIRFYYDGEKVYETPSGPMGDISTDAPFTIGGKAGGVGDASVQIDEVKVVGRALSTREILGDSSYPIYLSPREGRTVVIRGRAGKAPQMFHLDIVPKTGERTSWTITAQDHTFQMGEKARYSGVVDPQNVSVADAYLQLPWGLRYFIRPDPFCYELNKQKELVATWENFPPASQHIFKLELKYRNKMLEFWIDGRFVGTISLSAELDHVMLTVNKGNALQEVQWEEPSDTNSFLPISLEGYARPGIMKEGELSLKPGLQTVGNVPIQVVSAKDSVDAGLSRCLLRKLWCGVLDNLYYKRTAFNGVPENIIFSVPKKQFIYAYLLCAVEDSPEKVPVLTARLTRYALEGRANAIADATVILPKPGEKPSEGISQVGTFTYQKDGKSVNTPLWLVQIPINVGQIQDLLVDDNRGVWEFTDYFDLELTKAISGREGYGNKPEGPASAVHVFGLTLEESPVTMICRSKQVGNIFYSSEQPAFQVQLTNNSSKSGQYSIHWTYKDFDGKETKGSKDILLSTEKQVVEIPADLAQVGWYEASIRLLDGKGRLLVNHQTSFAVLPPDTRRAGYESPFGTWWFCKAHGGTERADIAGPMLLRAGLRHSTLGLFEGSPTEKEMNPYKVTIAYISYRNADFDQTLEKWMAENEKMIDRTMKKYPHCDSALIFHESSTPGCEDFPPEIYGGQPKQLTPEQEKMFKEQLWDRALALSKFYREKYPNIKIAFGNSWYSANLCAEFFRRKYPKEYIDYLSVEMQGREVIPERYVSGDGLQSTWDLKETARKLGYGDMPVTACFEWIGRSDRELGLKTQAEWYIRDCLHALAYGFHRINPAGLYDASTAYYHSIWGAGGLCKRFPVLAPKPSYVAYATLTRVLDCAKYIKNLPTGSDSLYVLEFQGRDGLVYALWTVRGTRAVTLDFSKDIGFTLTDLIGREKKISTQNKQAKLSVGTGAVYIKTSVPIQKVIPGASRFPEEKVPENLKVVYRMDSPADWEIKQNPGLEGSYLPGFPHYTQGKMEMRQVTDQERGSCLELEIVPEKEIPSITPEYTLFQLKEPVSIPGEFKSGALWVKGNSGWGWIALEYIDAKGSRYFFGGGPATESCDLPGNTIINFDGWNLLRFKFGDNINYPIKISGILVAMRRKHVYLTEMIPIHNLKIRLQNLSVF